MRPITDDNLARAIEAYNRNRNGRPDYSATGPFAFRKYHPDELKGWDAYVLMYITRPTKEAKAAKAEHIKDEAVRLGASPGKGR